MTTALETVKNRAHPTARRRVALAGVALAAVVLASCAGTSSPEGDDEDPASDGNGVSFPIVDVRDDPEAFAALVAAAQDEGRVVWYTSVNTENADAIAGMFEEEYGIEVIVQRSGGEDTLQRFLLEADAGQVQNDLLSISDPGAFVTLEEAGYFDCFTPRAYDDLAEWAQSESGCWSAHRGTIQVMGYRTDLVDDPPTSYRDLLDPQYAGQIAHGNPNFGSQMMIATVTLADLLGLEFYEELATLNPMIAQGNAQLEDVLATGERSIVVFSAAGAFLESMAVGGNLQLVYPEEGALFIAGPNAVPNGAPNPNAGRLLMDFLLTEGPLRQTVDGGQYGGVLDFDAPEGLEALTDLNLVPVDIEWVMEEGPEIVAEFTRIMGAESGN